MQCKANQALAAGMLWYATATLNWSTHLFYLRDTMYLSLFFPFSGYKRIDKYTNEYSICIRK